MSSSLFTLEALEAGEGDCLILHYGSTDAPRQMLIDGGPAGTFKKTLRNRLQEIGENLGQMPLELEHILVTHLDSDHIRGVLDLAKRMGDEDCPAQCDSFWLNTFDDELLQRLPEPAQQARTRAHGSALAGVTASVGEGLALHDEIARLHAVRNGGADVLVADAAPLLLELAPDQFEATLICPDLRHLQALAADWKKKTKKSDAALSEYLDESVYNLSSLVLVLRASHGGNGDATMLLTGDARGDHILAGLAHAGLLDDDGAVVFDVLKVPHHGSDRNLEPAFFESVQARHYVISANGRHDNPSIETLLWIAQGARDPDYRIWLTNDDNPLKPVLAENIAAAVAAMPSLQEHLHARAADAPSVMIDLFAQVQY
jgi:beta-lactamase superfamily II metal-dependent hydrolase